MTPYPAPFRLPRNPLQSASVAAGVLMLIAGIFAMIFGTVLLIHEAVDEVGVGPDGVSTVIQPVPFFLSIILLVAFVLSVIGCYGCFRLMRFEYALLSPLFMLIAYFLGLLYSAWILIVTLEVLILSIAALVLVVYARPVFTNPRGNVWKDPPAPSGRERPREDQFDNG